MPYKYTSANIKLSSQVYFTTFWSVCQCFWGILQRAVYPSFRRAKPCGNLLRYTPLGRFFPSVGITIPHRFSSGALGYCKENSILGHRKRETYAFAHLVPTRRYQRLALRATRPPTGEPSNLPYPSLRTPQGCGNLFPPPNSEPHKAVPVQGKVG